MALVIVILEDDQRRTVAMKKQLRVIAPTAVCSFFENAPDMIAWLQINLASVDLFCLDHDLILENPEEGNPFDPGTGRDVVDFLCKKEPICPVLIHSTNAPAVIGMQGELQDAGWSYERVIPFDDLTWIRTVWREEMKKLLSQLQ